MGWLLDKAKKISARASYRWIAKKMQRDEPLVPGGPQTEGLANNVGKLDQGEKVAWWLKKEHAPYRSALAQALHTDVGELEAAIGRLGDATDPGRWFDFEVFPGLRSLDLDADELYPGIPPELVEDDGPLGRTWWYAPQGAGRTLVGRWLERRRGWHRGSLASASSPAFVELETDQAADDVRARRIIVASPRRMPGRLGELGWREITTPRGWLRALIQWVAGRVRPGGRFDATSAQRWFDQVGHAQIDTPGQALELLAEMDAGGLEALNKTSSGRDALTRWAAAHAERKDRVVRPASRAFLRDHGARLVVEMEVKRRLLDLPATKENLVICVPEQPPCPDADTVYEALQHGGEAAALEVVKPGAANLVEAMIGLRWMVDEGWGFPSRVHRWLMQAVVDEIVALPLPQIGAALGHDDLVAPLLSALAHPKRLAVALEEVESLDPDNATTVLALDAVARSAALCLCRGGVLPVDGLRALSRALTAVSACRPPWPALPFGLPSDPRWGALSLLVLHRRAAGSAPESPDAGPLWDLVQYVDDLLVQWHEDPEDPIVAELRRLAIDELADLVSDHRGAPHRPLTVSAMRDLVNGESVDQDAMIRLAGVGPIRLLERLLARWGGTWEALGRILWPLWLERHDSVPWQPPGGPEELSALNCVWAVAPANGLKLAHFRGVAAQVQRGVILPPSVWRQLATIDSGPGRQALVPHVPLHVLDDLVTTADEPVASWASATLWARASDSQEARLRALLVSDEQALLHRVLTSAPAPALPAALSLVESAGVSAATDQVIDRWLGAVMRSHPGQRQHAYRVWRRRR